MVDDALGVLLPLAVLLSPLAFAAESRGLLLAGWAGLVPLLASGPMSRLLAPALVVPAALGAAVAARSVRSSPSGGRRLAGAIVGLALAAQLGLVLWIVSTSYDTFGAIVGAESDRRNLERLRPYSAAFDWIDRNTRAGTVVLLLGENRGWHLSRPFHAAGNLDGPRVARWLESQGDEEGIARGVARLGASVVVLHLPWIATASPPPRPLTPLEREYVLELAPPVWERLRRFLATRATLRFRDREYLVFEIGGPPAESAPAP